MLPDHDGLIVEYAGMPDRPRYLAGIRHKQNVYADNGVPAVLLYPDDLRTRNWPQEVIARVEAHRPSKQKMILPYGAGRTYP